MYKRCAKYWWGAPVYLFVIAPYLGDHFFPVYDLTLGYTLNAVVGAFFILWLSRNETSVLGRLANAKPVARIGIASYSIYLWQTLATHRAHGPLQVSLGILFIAVMATASYCFIERPAADARAKIERLFGARHAEVLAVTTTRLS